MENQVRHFQILDIMSEQDTPDGIGVCPDVIDANAGKINGRVTIGVPAKVVHFLMNGTHDVQLVVIKRDEYLDVKDRIGATLLAEDLKGELEEMKGE